MQHPATLPMHPVDLLFGATIPQMQCYMVCAPARNLEIAELRGVVAELLDGTAIRFAYEMPRTLGMIRTLRLAEDTTAPVRVEGADALFDRLDGPLEGVLGERHWQLSAVVEGDALVLALLFDHYLCHGSAAQALLFQIHDRLYGVGQGDPLPSLGDAQMAAYRGVQERMAARFARDQGWAAHRTLELESAPLRTLARTLDLPFTEASMLWLARSIHDVAPRPRPMEIISFRMMQDWKSAADDPSFGNRGLQAQLWEMLPDGFYTAKDPSLGLGTRDLDEFVDFYRRFPFKGALTWFMRRAIERGKREHHRTDCEKLVLNNLGSTRYPFRRTMFFDPFNDGDRFGLAFVDGWGDRVTLQFAPPRRYLESFDWETFEARLHANLEEMLQNPRVSTRA